jgi:hypothetical protein
MTTDTERGRALLEARRDRIVTHTNVEPVGIDEFRSFIDLAIASDRRRQAAEHLDRVNNDTPLDGYPSSAVEVAASAFLDALHAENRSLDALLAHLAGEGVE